MILSLPVICICKMSWQVKGKTEKNENNKRMMTPIDVVFVKLVPSGKNEQRVLEAAYSIYNVKTRNRITKSFIFYHKNNRAVCEDTYSDYHTAPTESDGRSLLQLCRDKTVAKHKIKDFCDAFSEDLKNCFSNSVRHITFVGDHIWQTRSLLYPFMFCANPWIKIPSRRTLIHFVEFRTFVQPFSVVYTQMDEPFELPQWVFRALSDVTGQVNFFDEVVQLCRRLPKFQEKEVAEEGEVVEVKETTVASDSCMCCTSESCMLDVPHACDMDCDSCCQGNNEHYYETGCNKHSPGDGGQPCQPTGIVLRTPDGSTVLKPIPE